MAQPNGTESSTQQTLVDLLNACDVALLSARASIRLATVRSTPTRLYSLGPRHAIELDNGRALVIDQRSHQLEIFPDVQSAATQYHGTPLILRAVRPALVVRAKPIDPDSDSRLTASDRRFLTLLMRGLN